MGTVAQYCEQFRKDGKLQVRFAVFDESRPMPKTTIVVDATHCATLEDVESLAFASHASTGDAHPLYKELADACREGRSVSAKPPAPSNPPQSAPVQATSSAAPGGK